MDELTKSDWEEIRQSARDPVRAARGIYHGMLMGGASWCILIFILSRLTNCCENVSLWA